MTKINMKETKLQQAFQDEGNDRGFERKLEITIDQNGVFQLAKFCSFDKPTKIGGYAIDYNLRAYSTDDISNNSNDSYKEISPEEVFTLTKEKSELPNTELAINGDRVEKDVFETALENARLDTEKAIEARVFLEIIGSGIKSDSEHRRGGTHPVKTRRYEPTDSLNLELKQKAEKANNLGPEGQRER